MANELDGFSERERNVINNLLMRVHTPGLGYVNKVLYLYGGGEYTHLLQPDPDGTARPSEAKLPTDITPRHSRAGMIVREGRKAFSFTPVAYTWYQHSVQPSAESIQRTIGEELFERYRAHQQSRMRQDQIIDVPDFLERTGLPRDTYIINARIPISLGMARQGPHGENTLETGGLLLTEPAGVAWANSGFPLAGSGPSTTVVVTIELTIHNAIEQAHALPIDDGLKDRLELLLSRVEREHRQGKVAWEPIKSLLELTANTAQLLPVIAPLLLQLAPYVEQLPLA